MNKDYNSRDLSNKELINISGGGFPTPWDVARSTITVVAHFGNIWIEAFKKGSRDF